MVYALVSDHLGLTCQPVIRDNVGEKIVHIVSIPKKYIRLTKFIVKLKINKCTYNKLSRARTPKT